MTREQVNAERAINPDFDAACRYWLDDGGLTLEEKLDYWVHYTVGTGKGMYSSVYAGTSFVEFMILSHQETLFCQFYDI